MNNHFVSPKAHTIPNLSNKVMRLFRHKITIQPLFFISHVFQMNIKFRYYNVKSSFNLEPQDRFWLSWLKFVMTLSNNSRLMP